MLALVLLASAFVPQPLVPQRDLVLQPRLPRRANAADAPRGGAGGARMLLPSSLLAGVDADGFSSSRTLIGEFLRDGTDIYYAFLVLCGLGYLAYNSASGMVNEAKAKDDDMRQRVDMKDQAMRDAFRQARDNE